MTNEIKKNVEDVDVDEDIERAVNEYRQKLIEFKKEMFNAADGTLLEVADKQIIENFEPMLKNIQQQMLQKYINKRQNSNDYRSCPKCKKKMRHKGRKSFEFITKAGNINVSGTYYHCDCDNSKSIAVLVSGGRKFSRTANELIIRYAAGQSYQQASKYLRKDFGIYMSHEMIRTHLSVISVQIKRIREERNDEYKWDEIKDSKLYGYVDGVLLNIRKEGWKECKLLRYEDEERKNIRHSGLLGSVRDFGLLARREAVNLGASAADEIVFLMDGAEGFHNHISKNFPLARQIVDYWHVCQHIGQCSEELYSADALAANRWRSKYCHMLREFGPDKVLSSLRKVKVRYRSGPKLRAICGLMSFLIRRLERINYPELLKAGYRVDSGAIESSCKNVVQSRLKGVGMRWSRRGAMAMLQVRFALASDSWDDVIAKCA